MPGVLYFATMVLAAFFDRLLPNADFAPQPGMAGTVALALLAVAVCNSLLNRARSRERSAGLERRQRVAAARRLVGESTGPSPRTIWLEEVQTMDRSWMPTVAGILNIIAGVLALLGTLGLIFVGAVVLAVPEMADEPEAELPLALVAGMIWAMVVLCFVAALLSIVGGIVALRRTGWAWPLVGAITAVFTAMPLGVFALIFVVLAEKELRGGPPATAAGAPSPQH